MARCVVQPGGRAKCAPPFIKRLPAFVVVVPEVAPGQIRADECRLIESAKSINYCTGSRAIIRRPTCVEQRELRRRLPALSFELADGLGCLCSVEKAHLLRPRLTPPRRSTVVS